MKILTSHRVLRGFALLCVSTFGSIVPASAVLYNFDTTTQLADYFNKGTTAGSGNGSLTNVASGGLSNSGSLAIPAATNDSFIYTTKTGLSPTLSTINVSVYFKALASTLAGGLTLTTGLVDVSPATTTSGTSAVSIPDAATANSFTLSLRNAGVTVSSGLSYALTSYNNAASAGSTSSAVLLTAGNWYQLASTYTYNGANSYTLSGQIFNSDSAGVLGSALYVTAPTWTVTNAGLADGNVFGLLSSQNGIRRGLGAQLDNFALVPEPSTILLLSGGLGLLALRWYRRRSGVA